MRSSWNLIIPSITGEYGVWNPNCQSCGAFTCISFEVDLLIEFKIKFNI
jgi:hypothetical protein